MEGKVSQVLDLGLSYDFIEKKQKTFVIFFKLNFLDFIKQNLRSR